MIALYTTSPHLAGLLNEGNLFSEVLYRRLGEGPGERVEVSK